MRIGIDFDNTIVTYDALFHRVACDQGVICPDLPRTKLAVRDYLRAAGQEPVWTAMQGEVYGNRLLEAEPFPGVVEFFDWARLNGIELIIVSHKTRHPYIGPPYDLHAIARQWIRRHLIVAGQTLVDDDRAFFELTKEAKVERIAHCACDYFIDDLPEILNAPAFPPATIPMLFAPDGTVTDTVNSIFSHWSAIRAFFEAL